MGSTKAFHFRRRRWRLVSASARGWAASPIGSSTRCAVAGPMPGIGCVTRNPAIGPRGFSEPQQCQQVLHMGGFEKFQPAELHEGNIPARQFDFGRPLWLDVRCGSPGRRPSTTIALSYPRGNFRLPRRYDCRRSTSTMTIVAARTRRPGIAPVCSPRSKMGMPAASVASYPSTRCTKRRPSAGMSCTSSGLCSRRRSKSMMLTSARKPGASRPRSDRPKKSAVSLVCRLTRCSRGSRGPRWRSRPQCASMKLGRPESTIEVQCAPPSLRPSRQAGSLSISRIGSWSPSRNSPPGRTDLILLRRCSRRRFHREYGSVRAAIAATLFSGPGS